MKPPRPPVAIVGAACLVPGARGLDAFWQRLESGAEPFARLPLDRWDPEVYAADLPFGLGDGCPLDRGAVLQDFTVDWRTLRLPPLQVERRHRIERAMLVTMSEALRDAGVTPDSGPFDRGEIFIAASTLGLDPATDHGRRIRRFELAAPVSEALAARLPQRRSEIDLLIDRASDRAAPPIHPDSMATSASVIAGRLANLYDFRGGHCAIDVGMASSLAAIDRAQAALGTGACDLALVCGVSPLLTPPTLLGFAHRGYLGASAPRPFDRRSRGTLLGEGCAAVVLVRAADLGGRRVYAFIESVGSAFAPGDGAAPVERAVREAVETALRDGGCAARDVGFIESRAAGIPEIDAAEARGLRDALRLGGEGGAPQLTSSVPHVGFLQAAAGLLALVKAALCLARRRWPGQPGGGIGTVAESSLTVPSEAVALSGRERALVVDAGLGPLAYCALLRSPGGEAEGVTAATAPPAPPLRRPSDGVAIVGCGILVPQAASVSEFWANILDRVDAIGDLPRSRWDVDQLVGTSQELGALLRAPLAGVVQLPPLDPARFGLQAQDLRALDSSVILALLASEQALLDAGPSRERWDPARVRVVLGQLPIRAVQVDAEKRALFASHLRLCADVMRSAGVGEGEVKAVLAAARAIFERGSTPLSPRTLDAFTGLTAVARVAEAFGLRGGALSVDSACGSSLSAVQMAVDALLLGEADAVLCGGVAANLLPEYYLTLGLLGFLSSQVEAPFSLRGDGFIPAEGAGVVVLRRLSDALAAGEPIYAVIRGVGASSDGRGRAIFAPNPDGQRRAIERALAAAGLKPKDIDLLEAHAAGTRLGDRAEMEAYAAVFGERDPGTPLTIGTLKSQIGHLSSAAGIAGLIKTALALREGYLPAGMSDAAPHPELPFARLPLELAGEPRPWIVAPARPRRAGVSAFGLGGVNYHVVLEEPPSGSERRRRPPALADHPASPPARGPFADRFVPEVAPLSLPPRAPQFPLRDRHVLLHLPEVPGAAAAAAAALVAALRARGARVSQLPAVPEGEIPARVAAACAAEGPLGGVIDLSMLGPGPGPDRTAEFSDALARRGGRAFALLRATYEVLAERTPRCYVSLTALGGGLGVLPCAGESALGVLLIGMMKGLKQELPHLQAKAIDFDPRMPPDDLAEATLREIEDGNDRMEVGYAGRRMIVNLRREPFLADAPLVRPFEPGEVFLFSGGGYGVAFECAAALARLGVVVVTCGRTELPAPAPWLDLDDEAFAAFRTEELQRRRAADPRLTPVRFAEAFAPLQRQRELHRNLLRARRHGLPLHYQVCDITDGAQVAQLLRWVRTRYGPVRGIAHAAMVEWSRSFPRKTPAMIERTISTKVLGLCHLLDAAEAEGEPLRIVVCFGSGAGRFGNRGQVDYSAANALMATVLGARARRFPRPLSHVTINWPAWRDVGAAVKDPDMAALVHATGVTSIAPAEGTYWFLSELALGRSGESVLFEERMLHDWPFLGRRTEGTGARAAEFDDRGVPLVPGAWPLCDYLVERRHGRARFERRLEVERDYFLAQHRLHGTPIVPITFGCEILAEAAVLTSPGWEIEAAEELSVAEPVKLHRHAPLLLRASAEVVGEEGGARIALTETRSDLLLRGRLPQRDRLHHRARFRLRPAGSRPPRRWIVPEPMGPTHARSFFHMAGDPVGLGPLFCRAQGIQVTDTGVTGRVRAPRQRDILRDTSYPIFQVDPLLLDAAFQVAANWDGYRHGCVSIPLGLGRMVLGRPRGRAEETRVQAVVVRIADPDVLYDVFVAGEDDALLVELRGLHLRRIARIPPQL